MSDGPAVSCPKCRAPLSLLAGLEPQSSRCPGCQLEFEYLPFPVPPAPPQQAERAVATADTVCYFHPENRAEVACDDCGRFLCPVCSITVGDRHLCPACVSLEERKRTSAALKQRILFDNVALAMVFGPLVVFPFTILTSPAALGVVAFGWRKPGSVVRSRHFRFAIAALVAATEIAGWAMIFWKAKTAERRHTTTVRYYSPR